MSSHAMASQARILRPATKIHAIRLWDWAAVESSGRRADTMRAQAQRLPAASAAPRAHERAERAPRKAKRARERTLPAMRTEVTWIRGGTGAYITRMSGGALSRGGEDEDEHGTRTKKTRPRT